MFNCDMSEALEPNLANYRSLDEFFRRNLKPEVRPICPDTLVSPADGHVVTFGKMLNGYVEQVKGISYKVETFFGQDLAAKVVIKKD